jgi:hypothetical protein
MDRPENQVLKSLTEEGDMKKVIVSTTINPPTEAILKYDSMPGWHLVVAGDLKTPDGYRLKNGTYLSPKDQESIDPTLSQMIGWNCIQRRNFGFIWAAKHGADIVATIDDDNIPLENWGKDLLVGKMAEVNHYETDAPCFDPVGLTEYPHLWHRGFPLQFLKERHYQTPTKKLVTVDVQADFWNGDPDIDAVCRLEHFPEVEFKKKMFPIAANKIAPFNSQNTFISRKALREYFLFPNIGRMDDIWAAFWLQAKKYSVVFNAASVYQQRNPHDLTVDFNHELLGYTRSYKLIPELYRDADAIFSFLPSGSREIFATYQRHFEK